MIAVEDSEVPEINVRLGEIVQKISSGDGDAFNQDFSKVAGIAPALKKRITRKSKVSGSSANESAMGYAAVDVAIPPYNLEYLAKIYEISSPNYAAVNAKASNVVGLGYEWIATPKTNELLTGLNTQGEKEKVNKKLAKAKQKLTDWLDDINPEDTFQEVLQKVWIDYESTGNGYLEIGRTALGEIEYIGHIPSTTMRVRNARDGFVQFSGRDATFFRNFGDDQTSNPVGNDTRPNEVIHIKNYTPNSGYYGAPDIVAALTALAGNEFAARFNLDYFEHRAVPRYVITVTGATLSSDAERKMTEFFATSVKGKNHRSIYIPLPKVTGGEQPKFEMQAVEANVQESSFHSYNKSNTTEILMAHQVPPSKVGMADGASLALARDADKTFKEQVCRPRQRNFEKRINRIVKERTDIFVLKLNELSLTDEETQSKIDERYLRMKTVTPNEIRARDGKPPLPGGDKVVDLKPQQAADQRATAGQSRERDRERANESPDVSGEGRNSKGEGRSAP